VFRPVRGVNPCRGMGSSYIPSSMRIEVDHTLSRIFRGRLNVRAVRDGYRRWVLSASARDTLKSAWELPIISKRSHG
jgi:hypothetical protein